MSVPNRRSALTNFILLTVGAFAGYQLAVIHLQTEKVAGQVILSQTQFQHMLRNMNSETWNQRKVTVEWHSQSVNTIHRKTNNSSTSSGDTTFRMGPSIPLDMKAFLNSSCKRLKSSKESHWFAEKFEETIKPVWCQDNRMLSQHVFKWWNSIQPGNETLTEVVDLLDSIGPGDGGLNTPAMKDRCCRCAIVGNSANIINSQYGEFIDAHSLIFRMNKCPSDNFKAHVGSKTTHYFAYPESFYQEYVREASLVFVPFKASDLQWLRNNLKAVNSTRFEANHSASRGQNLDNDKVLVYNPQLMWHTKKHWGIEKGLYPSTGFLAVIFAFHVCDEVNIFGFGPNRLGYWDHYYDKGSGEENSLFRKTFVHDAEEEMDVLYKLEAIGKIKIYRGSR